jgi:hypothetical protein
LRLSRYRTIVLAFLLIHPIWVVAVSKSEYPLTIKVLSAETESIPLNSDANGVLRDCNLLDYSAYCHYSRTAIVRNTMLVQDSDGKSFTLCCLADSRWSKCVLLAVGGTFQARKGKGGISVLYPDSRGKERTQLYQLFPEPALPPESAQEIAPEKVKCNFSSKPSGADITLDGGYVGSTPSEIGVKPGTHVVVISVPGFAEWKRELTVAADSIVNVTATLQKAQP